DDEGDTAPQFLVLHFAKLTVKLVDRGIQIHTFSGKFSFLGGVIRFKRHVHIKREGCQAEQGLSEASGIFVQLNQQSEDQDMNCRLQEIAVVNSANTGNQPKRESSARIGSDNDFFLFGLGYRPFLRRPSTCNQFRQTRFTIDTSTHIVYALGAKGMTAPDT